MQNWAIIESEEELKRAYSRFEEIRMAKKDDLDYKEKMLLLLLISQYEEQQSTLPYLDPIEFIKIRMDDFGYKQATLAAEYGDKGTVSKVLNYKQPLTLSMIRKFSKLLRIPADILIREYTLNH
jgi:HTH-type transcriptional regulator/antitoxin HigA